MAQKLTSQAIASIARRMRAVPEKVKQAAETEIRHRAEMLADDMRRDVRRYAYEDGALHDSIKVERVEGEAGQIAVRVQAGGASTTVSSTGARPYDYALGIEFGNSTSPARPFFYPNYRIHRRKIRSAVTRAMRKALKEGGLK